MNRLLELERSLAEQHGLVRAPWLRRARHSVAMGELSGNRLCELERELTGRPRARTGTGAPSSLARQDGLAVAATAPDALLAPDTDPTTVSVTAPPANDIFPMTRGKLVPLIDGQAAFTAMRAAIEGAENHIFITSWNFDLATKLPGRPARSIKDLLVDAAKRGVQVRVLLSFRQAQIKIWKKTIDLLGKGTREAAAIVGDLNRLHKNISALVDVHPWKVTIPLVVTDVRPGTVHERVLVVDGKTAFCGGFLFTTSQEQSTPRHNRANDKRHDVQSQITGPLVAHFEQHFAARWMAARSSSDPAVVADLTSHDAKQTDHAVQVVTTKADATGTTVVERLKQAYLTAVAGAQRYIYIENQYFRDADFTDALVKRLGQAPQLQIIVVVPVRPEEKPNDFALHAEFLQHEALTKLAAADAKRVGIYSLATSAKKSDAIYVHAKLMIVDDKWLTLGSANINRRSFGLDDEINVVVRDDAVAASLRVALWSEHLSLSETEIKTKFALANAATFVGLFNDAVAANEKQTKSGKSMTSRLLKHVPGPGRKLNLTGPIDADRFTFNDAEIEEPGHQGTAVA